MIGDKDREYFLLVFAIADHLGWRVHDDTDSGDWVSKEWLEIAWPERQRIAKQAQRDEPRAWRRNDR
jgi:hypothetical protein